MPLCIIDHIGFCQQQKPVTCFIGFFQCNLKFGYEIRSTVSILCFMDIGTDTGAGTTNLIADDRFVLTFEKLDQIQYFNSEGNGKINQFVFRFWHRCSYWR